MRISVIGAYGFTGKLICQELDKSKIEFSIYGRSIEKLSDLKSHYDLIKEVGALDIRIEKEIEGLINVSDLIINCAGPFTEESSLLVEKIAQSDKIYLDITGEVGFVRASKEYIDQLEEGTKSLIIHGVAFESLLADVGLQYLAKNMEIVMQCRSFYSFNKNKVSPGTRITMKLAKHRKTLKIHQYKWKESDFEKDQLKVILNKGLNKIAIPYPLPEIAYNKWNENISNSESFLLLNPSEVKFMSFSSKPSGVPLDILDKIRLRKTNGPNMEERSSQESLIVICAEDGSGKGFNLFLKSHDMYLTSARAMLLTVKEIINSDVSVCGVRSPAFLFKGKEEELFDRLNVQIMSNQQIVIESLV